MSKRTRATRGSERAPASRTRRIAFVTTALAVLAVALGLVTYRISGEAASSTGSPALSNFVRFHSPSTGSAEAKVQIVEFLDPACEGCKAFHPIVKSVLAENAGKVRLVVRYVPFHRGADFAVRALEAARNQGKWQDGLDTLFATQSTWTVNHTVNPRLVIASLGTVPGLDVQRLQTDMSAPELSKLIEQDMDDAKALKILQTPTFYVDGKLLQPFSVDAFRNLVKSEVKAQYP